MQRIETLGTKWSEVFKINVHPCDVTHCMNQMKERAHELEHVMFQHTIMRIE